MIYSRDISKVSSTQLSVRRLQDDPYVGMVLRQSPEFDAGVSENYSNSNSPRNTMRKGKGKAKWRKGKNKKIIPYNGPKAQRKAQQASSLAEMPGYGLPPAAFASGALGRLPSQPLLPVPAKGVNALDFAQSVVDGIGKGAAIVKTGVDAVKAIDDATGNRIGRRRPRNLPDGVSGNGDGNGSGGGGSKSTKSKSPNGGYNYTMVCNQPTSQKIEISTGVKSGLIVNPGEPNNDTDFSSLYIMCGNLFKKDVVDTSFKYYVENTIWPMVKQAVQYNLNFEYKLSLTDFNNWFYKLAKALEVYYALDSVLVYGEKVDNNNPGSRYLRSKITGPIKLKFNELRDLLGNQAIPPRMIQAVRFMYQYYKFSELPGSPLYRLSPGFIFNDDANPGSDSYVHRLSESMLDTLINDLNDLSDVHNYIYKALPEWHVPGKCLPPSCDTAYYDPNFRTFWFNASTTWVSDNNVNYSRSGSDTENFRYWLYSNIFDGFFFAMGSFNKTNEGGTRPGLWTPVTDYSQISDTARKVNCLNFCKEGGKSVRAISQSGDVLGKVLQFDNYKTPYRRVVANDQGVSISTISTCLNQDGSTQVAQECTFNTWKQAVYEVSKWIFMV